MSELYLSSFIDDGGMKWGIFFNNNGKVEPHCEKWTPQKGWIPLIFNSEEEATKKFDSIIDEYKREVMAIPFTEDEARAFANRHHWTFAQSYAKTVPHEYLVKAKLPFGEKLEFERFIVTMRGNFVNGYFYNLKNKYYILDDFYYWFSGHENMAIDLINRAPITDLKESNGIYYYERGRDDALS